MASSTSWNYFPTDNLLGANYAPSWQSAPLTGLPEVQIADPYKPVSANTNGLYQLNTRMPYAPTTVVDSPSTQSTASMSLNWKPSYNVLNASITGIFSAFSTLLQTGRNKEVYAYFNKQQDEAIKASVEQARRYTLQGDIALNKLRIQHALSQGTNELAVAGAKGRLSGSNLDKLAANFKYNMMDERTQRIETLWQVSNARIQGYQTALNASYKATEYANKQRANAFDAIGNYIKGVSGGLLADARQAAQQQAQQAMLNQYEKHMDRRLYIQHGKSASMRNPDTAVLNKPNVYSNGTITSGLEADAGVYTQTLRERFGSLLNLQYGDAPNYSLDTDASVTTQFKE